MKISKTHKALARELKLSKSLTNPEKYLGPNWEDVLNFWIYLDTLSELEKEEIADRYWALDEDIRRYSSYNSSEKAIEIIGIFFVESAYSATINLIPSLFSDGRLIVFAYATLELIAYHKLKDHLALSIVKYNS